MPRAARPHPTQHLVVDEPLENVGTLRVALLDWYDRNARMLPWRIPPGAAERADPYRVWLSEIMLQQTTVAAVRPRYAAFQEAFPDVHALAAAPQEAVLRLWAGLGYYSRARNLHAAARRLSVEGFPLDEAGWRALPGVGPYTAAAITAIALGLPANAVDGNVERVMARLSAEATPMPAAKPKLHAAAARFITAERPGDWVQALMDLGSGVCTPRTPRCGDCPLSTGCRAFAAGEPETYPRRAAKPARPERYGIAFRLTNGGRLLLERRPDTGLLGGMPGLPTTPWRETPWTLTEAFAHAPASADWRSAGTVTHVFTHFRLTLEIADATIDAPPQGDWVDEEALSDAGLPTVFRKAALLAPGPSLRAPAGAIKAGRYRPRRKDNG